MLKKLKWLPALAVAGCVVSGQSVQAQELPEAIAGEAVSSGNLEQDAQNAIAEAQRVINAARPESLAAAAVADGARSAAELQSTLSELLEVLVKEGVLTEEKARELVKSALENAASRNAGENPMEEGVVRVPYVPEIVKDEIRESVRADLRTDVVGDVMAQAKTERWGVPNALPEWISRIKWKGDVRVRGQNDAFADGNVEAGPESLYFDFQKINEEGGAGQLSFSELYLNTTEDRQRLRIRARLGMDAQVSNTLKASVRLSTGNTNDPVSTNQTLGQYGSRYQVVWDQAYLTYRGPVAATHPWLTLWGGRMPNPWLSTDLVWDSDLAFEGLAARMTYNLRGSGGLFDMAEQGRSLFVTAGAFPLQEVELSSSDKWLFGAQLGVDWKFKNQSRFRLGVAYYDFVNVAGKRNDFGSDEYDFTAPEFMQKGNKLFDIRNDDDLDTDLWALASDYNELNIIAAWDFAQLAPIHVVLTADYVKNIGYDKNEVADRVGGAENIARAGGFDAGINENDEVVLLEDPLDEETEGYQLKVAVGWPDLTVPGNWRVSLAFKRLEGDAVLDAFTDSDFHLGGTNAEGWILTGEYGLSENSWLTARYITADEIYGQPFGVEVLQVDVNAKF